MVGEAIVKLLNEALVWDRDAVATLIDQRVPANGLRDHPTIQCWAPDFKSEPSVGLLGILNGVKNCCR
jgi:hypothetical protein